MSDHLFSSNPWEDSIEGNVWFADGALSSLFNRYGLPEEMPSAWWNRQRPDRVLKAHLEYAKAGSQILTTNTFGATKSLLRTINLENYTRALNMQAVALAKAASGIQKNIQIWGSVGPVSNELRPSTARDEYREQMELLAEAGVDAIIIESMTHLEDATIAIQASNNIDVPIIVCFVVDGVGALPGDETPGLRAIRVMVEEGANAVGYNSSSEFEILENLVTRASDCVSVPIVVKPSCGTPDRVAGEWRYPFNPLKWAGRTLRLRQAGAKVLGGCSGSTPKHIETLWMHALVDAGRRTPDRLE